MLIVGSGKGGTDPRDSQGVESTWQFLKWGQEDLYVTYTSRFLAIRNVPFTEARNTDGKAGVREKMTISNLEMSS